MSSNTLPTLPDQTETPSLLSLARLAPRDEPPLNLYLAAVDALVQWQLSAKEQAGPAADAVTLLAQLQSFTHDYLTIYRQCVWDESQRKTVDSALVTIVAHRLAQPEVAVHGGFGPDQLLLASHTPARFVVNAAPSVSPGSGAYDLASLTRDPRLLWDEAFTLDVAIRYWDQARKAGLPVDADFGEFYRNLEWTALLRHLHLLGLRAQAANPQAPEDGPALMALVLATCNRYIELKPLLRLLERIEGLDVQGGFVFGRM